ncbi:MAG: nucleoside recognition domain-containing protein [Dethiobacteria bacterium]|nr:nucleoside recognition protein [Bacillota bacterium]
MINFLWLGMICIAIVVAGFSGNIEIVAESIFNHAEEAVNIAFSLISIMAFWLGIMKLIEKSGLIEVIKTIFQPIAFLLFPKIPRKHPAMNAILMNMSANFLGMGNAATPFGLKAMEEMQKLNSTPDTATDEMCTFLVLNTSSLTIIPTTVIALRISAGSLNAAEIVLPTIVATFCSTAVALIMDRLLRRRY